ncbi:hypothetical protein LXL04_021567 [Taraxacum kok-saghyz]
MRTSPSLHHLRPIPAIDFATLSIIVFLLLLSVLSLFRILHLRLKSQSSHHLRRFNNLWTLRLLLVFFVSCWAVNQILRLPFIGESLLLLLPLHLQLHSDLCKFHVLLSLGVFEPGFLVTILHLINLSIKNRIPPEKPEKWSMLLVTLMILPTFILQIIILFLTTPLMEKLPSEMTRTRLLYVDSYGKKMIICTYPLLSSIVFCGFAIVYSLGLLVACWRVVALVINKNVKVRINVLGVVVMVALFVQAVMLGAEGLWMPENVGGGMVSLGMFLSVAVCAVVGEILLVIKPIMEALETHK